MAGGIEASGSSPVDQLPPHATPSIGAGAAPPLPFSAAAAARSASPTRKAAALNNRTLSDGADTPFPAPLMRCSGSAPALPPLPPLVAAPRGAVRIRSVAGLHEGSQGCRGTAEPLPGRGAPQMFRTAPLPISGLDRREGDSVALVNQAQVPVPPSLSPPAQPPPPRQATRDDTASYRAPKLPTAVVGQSERRLSESCYWRADPASSMVGPVRELTPAAAAPPEGWGTPDTVEPRLASARLQSVV